MRNCETAPLRHWRRVCLAAFASAGATALVLLGVLGSCAAAGQPSLTATTSPVSGPSADPGNDLTDPGVPGNPPPPAGGIDAPGPGSPDGGVVLPPAGPASFGCTLDPGQQEQECIRPQVAGKYSVCAAAPQLYAFKLVEKAASDGMLLRTWWFGGQDCQTLPFLANTVVTLVNDSPYPRNRATNLTGALIGATDDFLCEVPIHEPYFPDDWQHQTKCSWTGADSYLATFTNYGDRPVDVAEWYGDRRHGRTELRPGVPMVLPLHSHGEFYIGAGGPAGPPIKVAVTDYRVPDRELWIRDQARITGIPTGYFAVNLSPYAVRLQINYRNGEVWRGVLSAGQRVQLPLSNLVLHGQKAYGTGQIARVLFVAPGSGGNNNQMYKVLTPALEQRDFPNAFVTWLGRGYRSVRFDNLGPQPVVLTAWFIPYVVAVRQIQVQPGEYAYLPLSDPSTGTSATLVTGIVNPPLPGSTTIVKSSEWRACPAEGCGTQLTPKLNALTGSATGLDAGQVQLRLQGRLTLAPSSGGLDLGHASVDLASLLDEGGTVGELGADGVGELVEAARPYGVQLAPLARHGATTTFAETPPPGASPIFRMEVTPRGGRVFDFTLNVATSPLSGEPQLCSAGQPSVTDLATRFFIYDNQAHPVDVAATNPWECIGAPPEPSALLLQ